MMLLHPLLRKILIRLCTTIFSDRNVAKGGTNLKLQIEIFALETNKQTNIRAKTHTHTKDNKILTWRHKTRAYFIVQQMRMGKCQLFCACGHRRFGTELDLNGNCEAWNKCFCKMACGAVKLAL